MYENETTRPFLDYLSKAFYIFTPSDYKKGENRVSVAESAIFPLVTTSEGPSGVNEVAVRGSKSAPWRLSRRQQEKAAPMSPP